MKLKLVLFLFVFATFGKLVIAQDTNNAENNASAQSENFWSEEESDVSNSAKVAASLESYEKPMPKALENSCIPRNELREEARLLLRPFRYNMAKTSMITMKRYPQKYLLIVPIYANESHRIVFSSKGMPQPYGIKVYDHHPEAEAKKANVLFEANEEEFINTYELPEDYDNQYIFVEYVIPPSDAENRDYTIKGCAIMFMGYLYIPAGANEGTMTTEEEAVE